MFQTNPVGVELFSYAPINVKPQGGGGGEGGLPTGKRFWHLSVDPGSGI